MALEPLSVPAQVLTRREGQLGRITLNRPESVNALTHDMVDILTTALEGWAADDRVTRVLIDGAGDRGLCAGGDLRSDGVDPSAFLRAEYRLDALTAAYPKPYIAWMDGITMGGGVGVSAHGAIRIVTERSRVAMPETKIALCPDVGGTYLLARAPGQIGLHLGLTSASMTGADAIECGFADLQLRSDMKDAFVAALAEGEEPWAVATRLASDPGQSALALSRGWIDACYAEDTLAGILDRLRDSGAEATTAADRISAFSPMATTVTLAALRRAASLTLHECLSMEFVIMMQLSARADVGEGIRATLIDRSHTPRWSPERASDVDIDEVDALIRQHPVPTIW